MTAQHELVLLGDRYKFIVQYTNTPTWCTERSICSWSYWWLRYLLIYHNHIFFSSCTHAQLYVELTTCIEKLNMFNLWTHVESGPFSTPETGDIYKVLSTLRRHVERSVNIAATCRILLVECLHVDSVDEL